MTGRDKWMLAAVCVLTALGFVPIGRASSGARVHALA